VSECSVVTTRVQLHLGPASDECEALFAVSNIFVIFCLLLIMYSLRVNILRLVVSEIPVLYSLMGRSLFRLF